MFHSNCIEVKEGDEGVERGGMGVEITIKFNFRGINFPPPPLDYKKNLLVNFNVRESYL